MSERITVKQAVEVADEKKERFKSAMKRRGFQKSFWERVDVLSSNSCWEWQSTLSVRGYGVFSVYLGKINGDFISKTFTVHRIAWSMVFGEIQNGLQVLHKCDNPPCCNPSHLMLGTNLDNSKDKVRKKRHCFHENHPSAKLTMQKVLEIRELYVPRKFTMLHLAKFYKVSERTIFDIVHNKKWVTI